MYLLYSLLLTLAALLLLPYFAWQAFTQRKYLDNFKERWGRLPNEWRGDARPTIWLHAVSVGETLAAAPLVKALRARFPQHRLIVSTTTATGQAIARAQLREADGVCYFPFDWRFSVRRALDVLAPDVVVLMESELWPNCLRECRRRGVPVLVANGRISDRSYRRSRRVRWWLRPVYRNVTRWLMQSETDAARAQALGATAGRVSVSGNLKYDVGAAAQTAQQTAVAQALKARFRLDAAPLIIAGSTTEGEEALLLAAYAALRAHPAAAATRLLIAPRQPARFDAVAQVIENAGWSSARRSRTTLVSDADIILLDSIGELAALYQFATLVFVGGSLVPQGGHNLLEPALYGKPIVVGPHTFNFRAIVDEFLRRAAVVQLSGATAEELCAVWLQWLTQPASAQQLGARAQQTVADNQGATARTVEAVAALLVTKRS